MGGIIKSSCSSGGHEWEEVLQAVPLEEGSQIIQPLNREIKYPYLHAQSIYLSKKKLKRQFHSYTQQLQCTYCTHVYLEKLHLF